MRDVPTGTRASHKQAAVDAFARNQQARWPYTEFTRNQDARTGTKITCRHCGKKLSCKNITRLKHHLLNRNLCPAYLDYALQHGEGNKYVLEVRHYVPRPCAHVHALTYQALHKEGKRTLESGDAPSLDGHSPGTDAWHQELTRLLLEAITATGVGYAWVDHPTVVSFFRAALPEFTLPSAAQLAVLGGPCASPSDVAVAASLSREGLQGVPQVITPPQQQAAASPSQLVMQPLTTLALTAAPPALAMAPMQAAPVAMVNTTGGMAAVAPVMQAVAMAPAEMVVQQGVHAVQPMATYTVQAMQPVQAVQAVQAVQPVQAAAAPMQQQAAAAMQAAQATLQAVQHANAQTNAVLAGMAPGGEAAITPPSSDPTAQPTAQQPPLTMGDASMLPPVDMGEALMLQQLQPTHIPAAPEDVHEDVFLTAL